MKKLESYNKHDIVRRINKQNQEWQQNNILEIVNIHPYFVVKAVGIQRIK